MKHNALPFANLLLCVSLLLALGPAFAQQPDSRKTKTKSKTTKAQAAKPPTPTPTPTPPTLEGTYTLNDPDATERIKTAIERSVKGMPLGEDDARKVLEEANLPPPEQITISYTPTEVTITSSVAGTLITPANGKPIEWTWNGDKYDVSTKWDKGRLVRSFSTTERSRINTYSLDEGGKTLVLHVDGNGKKILLGVTIARLKRPLEYELRYKRISK